MYFSVYKVYEFVTIGKHTSKTIVHTECMLE